MLVLVWMPPQLSIYLSCSRTVFSVRTGCAACLLEAFLQRQESDMWVPEDTEKEELRDINAVHTDYNLSGNSYSNFSLQWIKCAPSGCFCQKGITVSSSWIWLAKLDGIRQKTLDHSTLLYRFTVINCRRQKKKSDFWWRHTQW